MKTKIPVRKGKRNKIKFFKCDYENTLENNLQNRISFSWKRKIRWMFVEKIFWEIPKYWDFYWPSYFVDLFKHLRSDVEVFLFWN